MKKRNFLINLSFLALFSTAATAASPVSSITEITDKWLSDFNAGSTESLVELYSDEAVVFQANNSIVGGSDAIADYLEEMSDLNIEDFIIWDVELDADGNVAYESALWRVTGTDKNGAEISYDVSVTNVMEKQNDGNWKIKLQRWN